MDFKTSKEYFDETYWRGAKGVKSGYSAADYSLNDYLHLAMAEYFDEIFDLSCKKVLDIGCGFGYLVYYLVAKGIDAYGQDISSYAIKESPIPTRVRECNKVEIKWCEQAPFDLITVIESIEHVPQAYVGQYVQNMVKVLKPNGYLYFSIPFSLADNDCDETHQTIQPREWWEKLLKHSGLKCRRDLEGVAYETEVQTPIMERSEFLARHYSWNVLIWQKPKRFFF